MGKKFRGVRKASATTIEIDFKCKGQRIKREPSDANLKAYLTEWLANKKTHLKASTYDDNRKTINNQLIPVFGDISLADLRRADVRDWVKTLGCGKK
jgi:hypothetical protein